jgi:hypothetical protein
LTSKENLAPMQKRSDPAHRRENHFWFSFGAQKRTQLNGRALSPCKKPSKRVS